MIALGRVSKETRGAVVLPNMYEDLICVTPGNQNFIPPDRCPA